MAVIISAGVTHANLPRIGWRTIEGTIEATSEAEGYEAERAAGQDTYDGWQPESLPARWWVEASGEVTANYMGIGAHDLGTLECEIKPQFWDGDEWQDIAAEQVIESDGAVFWLFPSITAERFGVSIETGDDMPTLGHIRFGRVLTSPRMANYTGDPLDEGERVTLRHNRSETGEFLGTIVEGNGLEFSIDIEHLPEAFRQGEWRAFKEWADRGGSFFIAPKPGPYPREVAYARTTNSPAVSRAIPNKNVSGNVSINCIGYAKP